MMTRAEVRQVVEELLDRLQTGNACAKEAMFALSMAVVAIREVTAIHPCTCQACRPVGGKHSA